MLSMHLNDMQKRSTRTIQRLPLIQNMLTHGTSAELHSQNSGVILKQSIPMTRHSLLIQMIAMCGTTEESPFVRINDLRMHSSRMIKQFQSIQASMQRGTPVDGHLLISDN